VHANVNLPSTHMDRRPAPLLAECRDHRPTEMKRTRWALSRWALSRSALSRSQVCQGQPARALLHMLTLLHGKSMSQHLSSRVAMAAWGQPGQGLPQPGVLCGGHPQAPLEAPESLGTELQAQAPRFLVVLPQHLAAWLWAAPQHASRRCPDQVASSRRLQQGSRMPREHVPIQRRQSLQCSLMPQDHAPRQRMKLDQCRHLHRSSPYTQTQCRQQPTAVRNAFALPPPNRLATPGHQSCPRLPLPLDLVVCSTVRLRQGSYLRAATRHCCHPHPRRLRPFRIS